MEICRENMYIQELVCLKRKACVLVEMSVDYKVVC